MSGTEKKIRVVVQGLVECSSLCSCEEVGGDGELFNKGEEGNISERNPISGQCLLNKCKRIRIVSIEEAKVL